MTFNTWIEDTGPKVIAKALNVDVTTVCNWKNGKQFPRPKKLVALRKLSKGKISYETMIHHFVKHN